VTRGRAFALAAVAAGALAAPAGSQVPAPAVIATPLPAWLAPGARLTVAGWARSDAAVALVVDGRRVAVSRSGPRGRFAVGATMGAAGRHAIVVVAGGSRVALGTLLVRSIVLAAVGDITPGEGVADSLASRGIAYPWSSVAPVLHAADIATGNLEGVISDAGAPVAHKEFHLRGGPALLQGAATVARIDVFTVANNHSLDYGPVAFLDTLRAAHQFGIETVGGGADLAEARRPVILERGGLRIAILGYSDVRPPGFDATAGAPGTAPAYPAEIAADVAHARRTADLVVVWFHWGIELETTPDARQEELARVALGSGADVVLGAHPHVLQPVERRGRTIVAWSLGNFVFPSHSRGTDTTGILLVRLAASGVVGTQFVPAHITGFRPVLDSR
jgi:poly-gamma-glutamate synthesis protein (capsule biosynthesis protein)